MLDSRAVLDGAVIDVGGIVMRVGASDLERATAVVSLFGFAQVSADDPIFDLLFEAEPVATPTSPPLVDLIPDAALWHVDEHSTTIRYSGLTAHATGDRLVIGGGSVAGTALARDFRHIALLGLMYALAHRHRYVFHGAAVVFGDQAVLLLGPSSSGKSSAAFAALQSNARMLADDAIMITDRDGALHVAGIPRPPLVPADVAGTVTGSRPLADDDRHRFELPAGTLAHGSFPVAGSVIVGWNDHPFAALMPTSGASALPMIIGSTASVTDPALRPGLVSMSARLARLPVWNLLHSNDSANRMAQASARLDEVAAAINPQFQPGGAA